MSADLAAAYRDLRGRVIDLAKDLTTAEAERQVPCCPAWSVRDLLCHLAGVPADILAGNTADAATVAWADSHVTRRQGWSVERILAELDDAGRQVDDLVTAVGDRFPPAFFLDAWTHEADLAHALGQPTGGDLRLVDHALDPLIDGADRTFAEAGVGPVTIVGLGHDRVIGAVDTTAGDASDIAAVRPLGDGAEVEPARLHTTRFEFTRARMGRRSRAQLTALDWRGIDGAVAGPLLVVWSPNPVDIVEAEPPAD